MTENSIGYPGRFPPSLSEISGPDGNNDGHRDPEHDNDAAEGTRLDTERGRERTRIDPHPHNRTGPSITGILELVGTCE